MPCKTRGEKRQNTTQNAWGQGFTLSLSLSLSFVGFAYFAALSFAYFSVKIHKITQKFSQIHAFRAVGVNFCLTFLKNSAHFLNFRPKIHGIFSRFSQKFQIFQIFPNQFTNFANFFKKFSLRLRKRQPVSQGRGKIPSFKVKKHLRTRQHSICQNQKCGKTCQNQKRDFTLNQKNF